MAKKTAKKATTKQATTKSPASKGGTATAPATKSSARKAKASPDDNAAGKIAGYSSDEVRQVTGRTWPEWFHILDKVDAKGMKHAQIASWLADNYPELDATWAQTLTVGYEQEHGLGEANGESDGHAVTTTKTMDTPVGAIFRAWNDTRTRRKWLPDSIEIRMATKDKSMRVTWADGSHVDADFTPKGVGKSQIAIKHRKLKSAKDAAKMKAYWGKRLDALKELLES